jgi:urea carboxylase system permease
MGRPPDTGEELSTMNETDQGRAVVDADDAELARLGYRRDLRRTLGSFSTFAVSFGTISVLAGVFTAFGLGYAFAGPTVIWVWIVVFLFQLTVALVFAELAGRFPLTGSVYQWSKQVGGNGWGWAAGWLYITALFAGQASLGSAIQQVLTSITKQFQLVGDHVPGIFDANFAKNALILGVVMYVLTTTVNVLGVRVLARLANTLVLLELAGLALAIILMLANATRGPGVVTNSLGVGEGHSWGLFGALLIGAFLPLFTFFGFDNAASMAEETHEARKRGPQSLLRAYIASGVLGAVLILVALLAIPKLTDPNVAGLGLSYVVPAITSDAVAKILLIDVALALFGAATAGQALLTRMIFSMARDNQLPFAHTLSAVSPRTQTPIAAALVSALVPMAILLIGLGNPKLFQAVVSIALVLVYLGYLCVTAPTLRKRLGGWPANDPEAAGGFALGRWGLPLNAVAVVWGAVMAVNLAWPRAEFFGPAWYQHYVAVIMVPLIGAVGVAYYLLAVRGRQQVLSEHSASAAPAAVDMVVGAG